VTDEQKPRNHNDTFNPKKEEEDTMTMTKNEEPEATARFATYNIKPSDVVSTTQKTASLVQANAAYASHPEIQQGVAAWLAAANAVDAASQKVKAAHLTLTALIVTLAADMAVWKRASQAMAALINTASAGSSQAITTWGFATSARSIAVATLVPPSGLRVTYSKQLVMTARWAAVSHHLGYSLQIGDGTPQGWGAIIACPKASYEPQGLAPGQKVALRVAVQRKNGLSNWSDALTVTVR
jgi:hypothetical protein